MISNYKTGQTVLDLFSEQVELLLNDKIIPDKNVSETSKECYKEILDEGLVASREKIIHGFLIGHPDLTDREITKGLGFKDPNMVRPRRKGLVDQGMVFNSGKRKCSVSKRKAKTWSVKPKKNKGVLL